MITFCLPHPWLPWWFSSKESTCSTGDPGSVPKLGRSPGEGNEWLPTPLFLPGEFHGQSKLVSYSAWDCEESDMNEQLTHTCSTHLFWFWPLHGFLDLCSPTTDWIQGPQQIGVLTTRSPGNYLHICKMYVVRPLQLWWFLKSFTVREFSIEKLDF